MRTLPVFALVAAAFAAAGCQSETSDSGVSVAQSPAVLPAQFTAPVKKPTLVRTLPHDKGAFTEGLEYVNGMLYEGTGLERASDIRVVDPESGAVKKKTQQAPEIFGEGITVWNGLVYQLTYRNGKGFVYEETADGFKQKTSFRIPTEGWGLTHDDRYLIRSDGSDRIYFLDPTTFRVKKTIYVKDGTRAQRYINELEYVDGYLYANIWMTAHIAKIDPRDGRIVAWYDCTELKERNPSYSADDVLNGIAYEPASKRFFLTGKRWASLYEVSLDGQTQQTAQVSSESL